MKIIPKNTGVKILEQTGKRTFSLTAEGKTLLSIKEPPVDWRLEPIQRRDVVQLNNQHRVETNSLPNNSNLSILPEDHTMLAVKKEKAAMEAAKEISNTHKILNLLTAQLNEAAEKNDKAKLNEIKEILNHMRSEGFLQSN